MLLAKESLSLTYYCDNCKEFVNAKDAYHCPVCDVCNRSVNIGTEKGLREWFDIPAKSKPVHYTADLLFQIKDKHIRTLINNAKEYAKMVSHVYMGESAPKARKIEKDIAEAIEQIERIMA